MHYSILLLFTFLAISQSKNEYYHSYNLTIGVPNLPKICCFKIRCADRHILGDTPHAISGRFCFFSYKRGTFKVRLNGYTDKPGFWQSNTITSYCSTIHNCVAKTNYLHRRRRFFKPNPYEPNHSLYVSERIELNPSVVAWHWGDF